MTDQHPVLNPYLQGDRVRLSYRTCSRPSASSPRQRRLSRRARLEGFTCDQGSIPRVAWPQTVRLGWVHAVGGLGLLTPRP